MITQKWDINNFQSRRIFFHKSSSWVETRLHPEFGWVWLCRSWEKVGVGFGFCFGFGFYHRKIRPTQLWVELSWVVAIFPKFCIVYFGLCNFYDNGGLFFQNFLSCGFIGTPCIYLLQFVFCILSLVNWFFIYCRVSQNTVFA